MSIISRITTWTAGQVLRAADLNGEFNNIINLFNNLDAGTATWANVSVNTLTITGTATGFIPAGTKMVFFQSAPPAGWTQIVTQNNKALRVVSTAGGGTGGTDPFSAPTATSHTHTMGNHTHSTPNHSHRLGDSVRNAGTNPIASGDGVGVKGAAGVDGQMLNYAFSAGGASGIQTKLSTTDSGGSGTSGAPSTNTTDSANVTPNSLQYIDVIVCSKD